VPALIPHILHKLRALRRREWIDLFAAQFALVKTQMRMKRIPVGTLTVRDTATPELESGDRERAHALARAVSRAADYGVFRPFCLVRAMALQELLDSNGIRGSAVRVGVRREAGEFSAHAWVVWRNELLGDREDHVARFTEVSDLRVLMDR
jgi:hypothetical protein